MLPPLTPEQLTATALHISVLDLTNCIDSASFSYDPDPDTAPQYDSFGRQTNTREQRLTLRAQLERTDLVQRAIQLIPGYVPPASFKSVHKTTDKIFLPVAQYPHHNFVGTLLGPRGRTLQRMERESGARISIRGRGSSKTSSHETEELHVILSSDIPAALEKARVLVLEVVESATRPENQNEFKREQLRELATLNGTLRDDACNMCGQHGHLRANCPDAQRYDAQRYDAQRSREPRDPRESREQKTYGMPPTNIEVNEAPKRKIDSNGSPHSLDYTGKRAAAEALFEDMMDDVQKRIRLAESGDKPHSNLSSSGDNQHISKSPPVLAPPGADVPGIAPPVLAASAPPVAPPGLSTAPPPGLAAPPEPPSFAPPPPEMPPPPPQSTLVPPPPPSIPPPWSSRYSSTTSSNRDC